MLGQIDRHEVFADTIYVDDFVTAFESQLADCIALSSRYRRNHGACDLPMAIIRLVPKTSTARYQGDTAKNCSARRNCREAIKQFHSDHEKAVIANGNRNLFFKYLNDRQGYSKIQPTLQQVDGSWMSSSEAVEVCNREFSKNFASVDSPCSDQCRDPSLITIVQQLQLNCTTSDIKLA